MADIKIKNIYYMLSYAFQTLRERGDDNVASEDFDNRGPSVLNRPVGVDNVASEDFDNIHNLFAAILVRGISAQVKRGLHRDYVQTQETLAGLRGRINIAETIKRQTLQQGKLVCSFDEFSVDSPHNQALKSVMLLFLRHGDVKPESKTALRKLLLYFADVAKVEPNAIRWDALKYHRNNASYRMLLGICRLTVEGLLLTTEHGTYKLAKWLQDEAMHRLYEKFVLSYYKCHYPEFSPNAPTIDWNITDGERSPYLPIMKTDITLQNGDRRLIIDTKYHKSGTMASNQRNNSGSSKYKSADLYQIYSYVKNKDKDSTGNVAGVLLYAKTDEAITPNEDMVIGGNRISLKTLDLNSDWRAIEDQLERLCVWLQGGE